MQIPQSLKKKSRSTRTPSSLLVLAPTGDAAHIPMSGSIGPRFSFTHYPQPGTANGAGATLLRAVPDPSAPLVKFLGMSPRGDGGGGGPGFALGTVGPILGEVGSSTARVLVEVRLSFWLGCFRCALSRFVAGRGGPFYGCETPEGMNGIVTMRPITQTTVV